MTESVFILSKVQRAYRELIRNHLRNHPTPPAWLLDGSVVCGISRGSQLDPAGQDQDYGVPLPRVVIECMSATHTANYSSQFRATVRVLLEEGADETSEEDHLCHCGDLFNLIVVPGIEQALTAAVNDLHVFLQVPISVAYAIEGRLWVASATFEVECLGRDFN